MSCYHIPHYINRNRKQRNEIVKSRRRVFSNVRTVKAFANEDTETIKFYDKNEYLYERSKYAANIYGFWQFYT